MNLSNQKSIIFLSIAFVVFISTIASIWPRFEAPPEACRLSALYAVVNAGRQHVKEQLPLDKQIEIEPGEVLITIETETEPEGCEGDLSVNWLLNFPNSIPSRIRTSGRAPDKTLEITVGNQDSEYIIHLFVEDTFRSAIYTIPLKVTGEQ